MAAFWISSGTVKSYDGDGNRSEAVAPVTEEETKVGAVGDAIALTDGFTHRITDGFTLGVPLNTPHGIPKHSAVAAAVLRADRLAGAVCVPLRERFSGFRRDGGRLRRHRLRPVRPRRGMPC